MRILWLFIGIIAVALGVIGAFLPILPTVPFLLVAAWAFARSSPEWRQRILDNPTYGHHVRAWQERGAISRKAKMLAITGMTISLGLTLWLGLPLGLVALQGAVCGAIALFLITRPAS